MGNILITDLCPRKCSFCFAREKIGHSQIENESKHISKSQMHNIMDFLEKTGENNLRLLGGEPTCHPEFIDIVKEAFGRGFHVHIFTNCIMPKKTADVLGSQSKKNLSVLVNVSPQAGDTKKQKEKVAYALKQLGDKANVGITITSPKIEYMFLIDYINEFKLRRNIRVGIAQPIVGASNEYLNPSLYQETGKAIVKMAQECIKQEILVGFDCGLTLCMFSEQEIGILATNSEGFKIVCHPIIDIDSDLNVWPCFPLSPILNTNLSMFKTQNHIFRFYQKKLAPYKTFGCKPECKDCIHLKRGQCNGGCLAHAINSFDRLPAKTIKNQAI